MHKRAKAIVASLVAVTTFAPTLASFVPMTASAGQVLGETTFDYKALPWHTCESSPAKQEFKIDKEFHITVIEPLGAESSKWDLQFRYRNLNFEKGHEYKVSFQAKSNRNGMELCSKIGSTDGKKEYFDLKPEGFVMGPHMGGGDMGWGKAVELSTTYQTWSGTFIPTEKLEGVEWAFHYAEDHNGYGGNARKGDEIFFDNMSIECMTCSNCDADPNEHYGAISRTYSADFDNFISVNQIGYYSNLAKIATLGDNKGDTMHGAKTIDLKEGSTYKWKLMKKGGGVAKEGTTGKAFYDQDSHDTVAKIDFSDYTTPGEYYLQIDGEDWRSFDFYIGDNIYSDSSHDMLKNALNYFYQNRSGIDIKEAYITSGSKSGLAHEGGHKKDTAYVQKIWKNEYLKPEEATTEYSAGQITANGGWYDAGDHGKYVVNGGISVWTLLNMYERAIQTDEGKAKFADGNTDTMLIPEGSNGIPDVIDECMYEIDFMSQMVVDSSISYYSKYAGLVYHKLHDHKWTGLATRPWDYETEWKTERIVKPPTLAATLNYVACCAQCARLLEPYDADKAADYYEAAKTSYAAYKQHWYKAAADEETNEKSLYAPMYQAKGGGPYGDNEVRDDAYWAACELFVTANALGKTSDASTYKSELEGNDYAKVYQVTTRITGGENATGDGSYTTFNWGNTASAGSISLLLNKKYLDSADVKTLEASVKDAADDYIKTEAEQGYGIPYKYDGPGYKDPNNLPDTITIHGYEWGSNSMVINNLVVLAYAYDITNDTKYMDGIVTGMDYLLGNNPLAFSFVSGYGKYTLKNPHHRYWSYELDKTLPMAPDGVLSGGPNAGLQDPYVRALGFEPGGDDVPSERCYVDSIEAWSTNEVTINWNAPLAWMVSFLQDEAADAGSNPHHEDDEVDWGNVDCSTESTVEERVTVLDAVLLARVAAEDTKCGVTEQGKLNADVEYDGKVKTDDLTKLLKYLAGIVKYSDLGNQE